MRWQGQGHNECFAVSVAMLAGVDRHVVIDWTRQYAGLLPTDAWATMVDKHGPSGFWIVAGATVKHFLSLDMSIGNSGLWDSYRPIPPEGVELKGRGLLGLAGQLGVHGFHAHCVAFENGWIFDPAEERCRPLSWRDWYGHRNNLWAAFNKHPLAREVSYGVGLTDASQAT